MDLKNRASQWADENREKAGTRWDEIPCLDYRSHTSPLATCPAIELAGLSRLGERLPANLLRHDVREPATTSLTLSGTR